MARRGPGKQYQRGEEVYVAGDADNHAFKAQAVKGRKRPIKSQPAMDKDTIAIESDDEPPRKARPDPHSSEAKLRAPKQGQRSTESRQESEDVISPEIVPRPNLPPTKLLQPFADEDADVYIVLIHKSPVYSYRMHSHILRRASSWFDFQLHGKFRDELDTGMAAVITKDTGIKYRIEIIFDAERRHFLLKRTGLTMYKNQPQTIISRAICPLGANGHSLQTNSTCHARDSSLFLPQYDGSFDDVEMGNMAGDLEAAVHLDISNFISFSGTLQPFLQNQANAHQEQGDSIKPEENTAVKLGSVDLAPQTQKATREQVFTPPSSPNKAGAGTKTDHMISEKPQVYLTTKNTPGGDTTTPIETTMKAEVEPEEKMFSENHLIAENLSERQLEIEIENANANGKIDEQRQPKFQPNQFASNHQVSPEEQLQTTIFSENPTEPEIKVEEAQKVTDPMFQVLPSMGVSPENRIDVAPDENLMVEEPQRGNSQNLKVFAAHVSPARHNEAPAHASLTVEEPKPLPQISLGAQELPEKEAEVRMNVKSTAEKKQQLKIDPIMNELSFDNLSAPKTVLPTTEKPNTNTPNQTPLAQQATTPHSDVLEAYNSLFLCYYNCPPTISTTDVSTAMKQSNLLIKVATLYDSLKIVRPHIIASLLSQGRNLYSAIRHDPPRFLILADKLQCTSIFKEAIIHIVGQLPSWPWPTLRDRIDGALSEFIHKKTQELQEKKYEVTHALFQSCLVKDGARVSINTLDKTTFDLWIMVQIWHDWFSQQLHRCAHARLHESASVEKNMYNLLAAGGDAYLQIAHVMSIVAQFKAVLENREWGHWEKNEVELQLNIMKKFAAEKVKGLMVNELMGDNSGGNGELAYLTCTKVDDYELPWAVSQIIED